MAEAATTLSLDRYAPDAKALVAAAQSLADERKHAEVQPLHLLVRALGRDQGVRAVFERGVSNLLEFEAALERALGNLPRSNEPAYLSASMLDLLERAQREADREKSENVSTEHVLNALSQEIRGPAGEILTAFGVLPGSLRQHMAALRSIPSVARAQNPVPGAFARPLLGDPDEPVLLRVAEVRRLLTILERSQKSHPLLVGEAGVGKGAVVRALRQRIACGDVPTSLASTKLLEIDTGALVAGARLRGEIEDRVKKLLGDLARSPQILLVRNVEQLFGQGPSGSAIGDVLKPALLRGELRLLATTTPEGLKRLEERDAQVLRLFTQLPILEPTLEQANEIVRGVAARYEKHHGVEIGERAILLAVQLAKRYVPDRCLPDSALDLLDEAAAAKRVEVDGVSSDADASLRRLESVRAQLRTLEHSEDAESQAAREKLRAELPALEEKNQQIRAEREARRGVVGAVRSLRAELDAVRAERESALGKKNFARVGEIEHAVLPELEARLAKAEEAAKSTAEPPPRILSERDVATTLAIWTGIPVAKMLEGEADKLLKMEARLAERVVGQEDAVAAVARAVRRGRVGLRDPGKPIGSFLFLGPSGVGKTELAKALARFLFDDDQALTRLDMSEFMERHMAQRLIGAPPGYADSEQGGFLTEAVRRRPYSVLLFDEVEKAHQDVFNLLLQVLDDGRLTDGRGRLADFSNTVVIMTSNIGSERILETDPKLFDSEAGREALRDVLIERLREFFRPEFLNRIDETLLFRPLTKQHLLSVVEIQLVQLERLLSERRLSLDLDEAAKTFLVDRGYEPALGARPIKRSILRHLQDPLAHALLSGKFADGSTVHVRVAGEALSFEASA
ncbi:MAG TPA: AAA family ATPase [Polyangiaceae bacterium]|jgi:ATP-dependent Clp protease ATP-binding subunit ClpB|nr:AAA family ATPase [Polyangiaceae bacterium]